MTEKQIKQCVEIIDEVLSESENPIVPFHAINTDLVKSMSDIIICFHRVLINTGVTEQGVIERMQKELENI